MNEKIYKLTIHFKSGGLIDITVRDKVPATTGHTLLAWSCTDGMYFMVNENHVEYIKCNPVEAGDE